MSAHRFTLGTPAVPSVAQDAPNAAQIRDQIREQIRQSIQGAAQQARDAAQEARDAQEQVREAQQELRDAQRELRDAQRQVRGASTAAQRSDAEQALAGAQSAVHGAEAALLGAEAQAQAAQHMGFGTMQHAPDMRHVIPQQAVDLAIGFFVLCAAMLIGWPIARAFGRRIERPARAGAVDSGLGDQLQRIEQAVEAMAIEVERISEAQRYMTKLRSGAAQADVELPKQR